MGIHPTERLPRREWEPAERKCCRCKAVKEITEFYPRKGYKGPQVKKKNVTSGRLSYCIDCSKKGSVKEGRERTLSQYTLDELFAEQASVIGRLKAVVEMIERKTQGKIGGTLTLPDSTGPLSADLPDGAG